MLIYELIYFKLVLNSVTVTGTFRDCLSRQVSEGVQIRRCAGFTNIMNSKSEWHQPVLWRVISEIERF